MKTQSQKPKTRSNLQSLTLREHAGVMEAVRKVLSRARLHRQLGTRIREVS